MGVPEGATDASLTPYHVARSKLFVRERFSDAIIDLDIPLIEKEYPTSMTLFWMENNSRA